MSTDASATFKDQDAVLVGGPRDETPFAAEGAALVELEIDGLVHRYIRTTQDRERHGRSLTVYNYDGVVDPGGAQPGVESPRTTGPDRRRGVAPG